MNLPPVGPLSSHATIPYGAPVGAGQTVPQGPTDEVELQRLPAPGLAPPTIQGHLAALPELGGSGLAAGMGGPLGPALARATVEQLRHQLEGLPVTYFKPPRFKLFGGKPKAISAEEAARRVNRGQAVTVHAHQQPVAFALRDDEDARVLEQFYRGAPLQGSAGILASQQQEGMQFLLSDGRAMDAHGAYRVLHDSPDQQVWARKPEAPLQEWNLATLHHAGELKEWVGQQALDPLFQTHPNPAHGLLEMVRHEQLDYPRLYQALEGVKSQHPNAPGWVSYTRRFLEQLQTAGYSTREAGEALKLVGEPAGPLDSGSRWQSFQQLAFRSHLSPAEGLSLYRTFSRGCRSGCAPEALHPQLVQTAARLAHFPQGERAQRLAELEHEATWPDRLLHSLTHGKVDQPPPPVMGVEHLQPKAVKGPPGSNSTPINAGSTFRMNLPGLGWVVSKVHNHSTRTHVEVLASEVDRLLPVPPGGSERVVPLTVPVQLDAPAQGERVSAPPGLYSAQEFVPNAVEFQTLIERGAVPEKPHPDFLRMRYLDQLMANRDRHAWNVLLDHQGVPKAIDNGYGMSKEAYYLPIKVNPEHDYLYDYVDYNNIGWRPFCAVPDQAAPEFLRQSYRYALAARHELTDQKLGQLVDSMRPLYPDVNDWNEILETLRHNRDQMPVMIASSMQRRGITP